jgi:hypothetical protein
MGVLFIFHMNNLLGDEMVWDGECGVVSQNGYGRYNCGCGYPDVAKNKPPYHSSAYAAATKQHPHNVGTPPVAKRFQKQQLVVVSQNLERLSWHLLSLRRPSYPNYGRLPPNFSGNFPFSLTHTPHSPAKQS